MGRFSAAKPAAPARRKPQQRRDSKPKKSNMKPQNIDEQEIPYKLRELMRSKENMKKKTKRKKTNEAKQNRTPTSGDSDSFGDIPVPKFQRKKRESVNHYIQRMEQETQHVMFMSNQQLPRFPEMEDTEKEEEGPVKTKSEKKKESDKKRLKRLIGKKMERKEMKLEKEMFTDVVPFGEVAMQPPTLTAQPRKSQATNQPGCRQLLLKSLIGGDKGSSERTKETSRNVKLPIRSMAHQRIMLEERERVIKAYRALKKQKLQALTRS
ncbi:coiled-coil domain-containing protein 137 [Rhinoraja longicauda]